MKDLTLKFVDRADFSAFMESIGYYDDESMQDDILIDVIGNVYKETGELTEDGEPVCVKEDGYFVNVRIINDAKNRQYSMNTWLLLSINFVAGCEEEKWLHRQ